MASLFSSMPLHGAHVVSNPAGLRVKRVARAIEHNAALAAKWQASPRAFLHDRDAMAAAIVAAQEWQQGQAKQIRKIKAEVAKRVGGRGAAFEAGVRDALAQAGIQTSARTGLKITSAGRRAIAAAMGAEQAYLNSKLRQRSRYLDVLSKATGKEIYGSGTRMRLKDFRLKNKPTKGKSWKGQLAASGGYAPLLDEFKLRAPGAASRNSELNALIMAKRQAGGAGWWNDAALMSEFKAARGAVRSSNKAKAAAGSTKGLTGRALADAMLARASSADIDRAYRSLGLVPLAPGVKAQRRAAREAELLAQGYTRAKSGRLISPAQRAHQQKFAADAKARKGEKKLKKVSNPFSGLALSNPNSGVGLLDQAESMVHRVPVVGPSLAAAVGPVAMSAAAFGALYFVVPVVQEYIPEQVRAASNTLTGVALGIATGAASRFAPAGSVRNALVGVGMAAAGVGVVLDLYNHFGGGNVSGLALSGSEDLSGLALGEAPSALSGLALSGLALGEAPSALGDGGAYQVSTLGNSTDYSALSAMYSDACWADAQCSGPDLDNREGQAALAGASAFMGAFGAAPLRASGPRKAESRHAGRPGHRWGWLIKWVGFQKFQQIAALPPQERVQIIRQLREQAMSAVTQMIEESRAAAAMQSAPVGELHGATAGYNLNGYGATVFAGGSY